MNLRPVSNETTWIDVDREYVRMLEMKALLLSTSPAKVIDSIGHKDEVVAGWDVLDLILDEMSNRFPGMVYRDGSMVINRVTGLIWNLDVTPPLQVASLLVQEDLVVMLPKYVDGEKSTHVLACGVVCFADRWQIKDKIGRTLHEIHETVGQYTAVANAVEQFFMSMGSQGLRVRYNFTFQTCSSLHFPEGEELPLPRVASAGPPQSYLRVERQGFRYLPRSDGVLFSIRTYLSPISELPAYAHGALRSALAGTARTSVSRDMVDMYKSAVLADLTV